MPPTGRIWIAMLTLVTALALAGHAGLGPAAAAQHHHDHG